MVAGCKPPTQRIGTEHENSLSQTDFSAAYDGPDGIKAMLEGLMAYGWDGKYEGDTLVGLSRPMEAGGGSVTLEPAGQLELSGAPLENIHQTCAEISAHMKQVHEVAARLGKAILASVTRRLNFVRPRSRKGAIV